MIVTAPTTLREHSQGSMQMKHRLLITLKVSLCLIPCAIAGAQENVTHDHGGGAQSGARLGTNWHAADAGHPAVKEARAGVR